MEEFFVEVSQKDGKGSVRVLQKGKGVEISPNATRLVCINAADKDDAIARVIVGEGLRCI
jgi:hypothetical protein